MKTELTDNGHARRSIVIPVTENRVIRFAAKEPAFYLYCY